MPCRNMLGSNQKECLIAVWTTRVYQTCVWLTLMEGNWHVVYYCSRIAEQGPGKGRDGRACSCECLAGSVRERSNQAGPDVEERIQVAAAMFRSLCLWLGQELARELSDSAASRQRSASGLLAD